MATAWFSCNCTLWQVLHIRGVEHLSQGLQGGVAMGKVLHGPVLRLQTAPDMQREESTHERMGQEFVIGKGSQHPYKTLIYSFILSANIRGRLRSPSCIRRLRNEQRTASSGE